MALLGTDRRILTLAFARMVDAVGNSFLIIVLPLYIESELVTGDLLGLGEAMIIGVTLSLFGFFNSFLQPFAGRTSDRTGKRRAFIILGLGILGVTNVLYAFAHDYWLLLGLRALQGVGVAFTIPVTVALVNELAGAATRGSNMGVFNTFRLLGFGAGPLAAGIVVVGGPYDLHLGAATLSLSGFEAAFYFAGAMAFASILLVWAFVRDPDELQARAAVDTRIAVRQRDGERLLDPVFTVAVASGLMAICIALFSTIEPQVNARLHQDARWFGLQFAGFLIPQVLLQAPVGHASDRWGRRPFIVWGMVLLVPTTLLMGFATTPLEMLAGRVVQGIGGAMVFAPALALAGDLAREGESGTSMSVLTMGFGLGLAFGPLSSGFLIRFGFAAPFAFGAAVALVGALLVWSQVEETAPQVVAAKGAASADPS